MLHAFLVLATEAAEEAESSQAAFYIAGGLFALWAVVLGVMGLRRPEFPTGDAGARGVMWISAILMIASMATAVITA